MKKQKIGNILIYASLSITFILWILAKNSIDEIVLWPLTSLTQITALLGTVLFVWSMILSTRLDFLELLFGGLDKVYRVHRRVSEIGMTLILIHPITLALDIPEIGMGYFLPNHAQKAINLGVYSFWVFAVTLILTLLIRKIKLPYHIWKFTHKFLNLAMILLLLHVIMIKSDTSLFPPLGMWMNLLVSLGVASGLYMTFFYKRFGPRYKYEVVNIERDNKLHDIYLKPLRSKLSHTLAQFAYVSFHSGKVSSEGHPYCITSLPEEDILRFSIKELGDYTKTLGNLEIGDTATIWGPYGQLGKPFESGVKDAIFIAGGIGVAPFLSMFRKASMQKGDRQTALFYCTKYKGEADFDVELKQLANDNTDLYYHNQCSREKGEGHLSIESILEKIRDINNTIIYLCGPANMMSTITKDLIESGVSEDNIILEDFDMI